MKKSTYVPFVEPVTSWLTHIRFRSLRVRLALWGLLLVGLTQLAVSIVLYLAISSWLEDQIDNNLLLTATQVSSVLYDAEDTRNPLDVADVSLQQGADNTATQSFLSDQLFFVRLIHVSTGEILATSANYPIPITPAQLRETNFDTVRSQENDRIAEIRLYTLHLSYAPRFALQVGVSLEETRAIQADIQRILIVLFLITGTLALFSGWFLANRALVPIRAIARTAGEINETDLSRRLDLTSSEVELEQLVLTFNAMLKRIEQAFQRQRQFTTDAAHELRTPLSIMQTGLEVSLSQERTAPEYRRLLISVQEEVQRLSQLANTLLLLSRSDSQDLSLTMAAVDLNMLLETIGDQFSLLAAEKQVSIERSIAPDLTIRGDEDRLIQVVFNLLDNAVKYTPAGGQVRIIAHPLKDAVEIEIADSGPGIPETEHERIFDRFYRVDHARNRSQGGFGLGLAIVKRIVEYHRGTIRLISQPDHGASFIVTLPL